MHIWHKYLMINKYKEPGLLLKIKKDAATDQYLRFKFDPKVKYLNTILLLPVVEVLKSL